MLGLPGESEKSLRTTLEHTSNMLAHSNVKGVVVSLLVPLPGSPSYDLMLKRQALREKYLSSDMLVLDEMQRDWISNFCHVDFETVKGYMEEMNNLAANVFPI